MSFRFGKRSMDNLQGVHSKLVSAAHRALELSSVDFTVIEGLRSRERQAELVKAKASWTMNSQHILGRAIDVAPWVGGTIRWDWPLFIPIARAFQLAAEEHGVIIRWGGTWNALNGAPKPSIGGLHKKRPDGPHFELGRNEI